MDNSIDTLVEETNSMTVEPKKKGRTKALIEAQKRYYEKRKNDPEFKKIQKESMKKYLNKIKDTDSYKARNRENVKRYYNENKEEILLKRKLYYLDNRDLLLERQRQYREKRNNNEDAE